MKAYDSGSVHRALLSAGPGERTGRALSLRRSWTRVRNYYERNAAHLCFRRRLAIRAELPLISFTFDDFPRSALLTGGAILRSFGLSGTYYASLGLLGKEEAAGPIFVPEDLAALLEQKHELGCHTFSHCHSWKTERATFEESIVRNRETLREIVPGAEFMSFSYPISEPRPMTKWRTAQHFLCCRGGGQAFNSGTADLNQLSAYFLEKTRGQIEPVRRFIELNRQARGWAIFATHDVCPNPSPYGCTPEFFEEVVRCAVNSGARILPVVRALEVLRGARTAS